MSERIILDIDLAGDDVLAVLVAAGHPDVSLEAVTAVTGTAGGVEHVTRIALNTLTLAGREDEPMAAGAWRPIVGNPKVDMEAPVHSQKRLRERFGDRLAGFDPPAPEPNRPAMDRHAVDLIMDTVRANPGEISPSWRPGRKPTSPWPCAWHPTSQGWCGASWCSAAASPRRATSRPWPNTMS